MGIDGNIKHQRGIISARRTSRTAPVQTHGQKEEAANYPRAATCRQAGYTPNCTKIAHYGKAQKKENFDGCLPVQEKETRQSAEQRGCRGGRSAPSHAACTVDERKDCTRPAVNSKVRVSFQTTPPLHQTISNCFLLITRSKDHLSLACSIWWPVCFLEQCPM